MPRFTERYPDLTPEAGYQAARARHQHRLSAGWRRAGRKIGFTNRTLWPRYGVYEPIWGNPRIEPEICFGLRPALQGERLIDCIEWIAHAVEIVQCHRGGELIDRGVGSNVLDSPLKALGHLVALLDKQDAPGDRWSTRLSGIDLPRLTLEFG